MQSERRLGANEDSDILELGTEMDIKNPSIEWCMHKFHRLVQRERCAGMIQMTSLVHHMLIKRRRDLVRRTIVHRPHRPDHRTETSKLHRRRKMDRLVRTLFVSDSRMTCREIRKFGILQIALDGALGRRAGRMRTRMAVSDLGDHDTQGGPIRSCQALR